MESIFNRARMTGDLNEKQTAIMYTNHLQTHFRNNVIFSTGAGGENAGAEKVLSITARLFVVQFYAKKTRLCFVVNLVFVYIYKNCVGRQQQNNTIKFQKCNFVQFSENK